MATYAELMAQAREIQEQALAMRDAEKAEALKTIKGLVEQYQISASELGSVYTRRGRPSSKLSTAGSTEKAAPKYQGPEGKTWSGHGRAPNWFKEALASGKTEADLLIK